jgi:hypothetical protein
MDIIPLLLAFFFLYLPAGYVLYRMRYPRGFIANDPDPERERLLRTSRRRVLPLPERRHRP